MNLIEGKVQWCGNGVVVIKERSVLQSVWRLCVYGERQLHSVFQRITSSFTNLLSKGVRLLENTGENTVSDNQLGDRSVSTKTIECQPVVMKTKKFSSPPKVQSIKRQSMKVRPNKVKPKGTLTEIRRYAGVEHANAVSGNEQNGLQQLLPALAGFCDDRWLVLVSPPQRPDAAALIAAGIDPSRVLLVHARDTHAFNNNADRSSGLNTVEQALQSGSCGAVVAWLEECDTSTLQRLRRAAVQGHAWGVMFREDEKETAQLEMVIG